MTTEPRVALNSLIQALEEHLTALSAKRGEQDTAVENAYLGIADAFEVYEDAIYVAYNEVTPLEVFVEDDDEDEEDYDELDDLDEDDDFEDLDEDDEDETPSR
ncbi:hypothetical protein [Kocuria massiliensis]|uniref:hypothetical protein n=1 Tax=Kocuria massiliensis TaxID=1926282 RepID=UPI000A1C9019|nr:hypothetical protein [Kocuria massiliensis]MCT1366833.1 hypothetical protein [Rothia sp. p3-SID1597]